jgi:hypothetical protein
MDTSDHAVNAATVWGRALWDETGMSYLYSPCILQKAVIPRHVSRTLTCAFLWLDLLFIGFYCSPVKLDLIDSSDLPYDRI